MACYLLRVILSLMAYIITLDKVYSSYRVCPHFATRSGYLTWLHYNGSKTDLKNIIFNLSVCIA